MDGAPDHATALQPTNKKHISEKSICIDLGRGYYPVSVAADANNKPNSIRPMKTIDNTSISEDIKTYLESKEGDSQRIFKFAGVGNAGGTILKSVKARKLTISEKVAAEIWQCKSSARPDLASAEDVIADAISKGFEAKPGAWEGSISVVRSRTPYTSWEVEVVGCGMSVRGHRPDVRRNVFELQLGGHDLTTPDAVTLLDSSDSEFEASVQESIKSWR